MSVSLPRNLILLCVGIFVYPEHTTGYFGISGREQVLIMTLGEHQRPMSNKIRTYAAPSVCDMLKLHGKQKRMCKRGKGVPETLIDATKLSLLECQAKFQNERWNCSMGIYRQNILRKSFKETSFLYSITSAGLVHAFARACSLQRLETCTCDESKNLAHRKTWGWGGCGDNIKFGLKFTRRFLGRARRSGKDVRAELDQHNTNLGLKVVKDHVRTTCKCHGVSGSCTTKTCWRQLLPFSAIGRILKDKYERAVKVASFKNQATGRSRLVKFQKNSKALNFSSGISPKKGDLIYLENSPSFCKKTRYSPGTYGRHCIKDSSCDIVCCGRGYNIQNIDVKKSCECRVIWCCYVKCKQCNVTEEVHTCK